MRTIEYSRAIFEVISDTLLEDAWRIWPESGPARLAIEAQLGPSEFRPDRHDRCTVEVEDRIAATIQLAAKGLIIGVAWDAVHKQTVMQTFTLTRRGWYWVMASFISKLNDDDLPGYMGAVDAIHDALGRDPKAEISPEDRINVEAEGEIAVAIATAVEQALDEPMPGETEPAFADAEADDTTRGFTFTRRGWYWIVTTLGDRTRFTPHVEPVIQTINDELDPRRLIGPAEPDNLVEIRFADDAARTVLLAVGVLLDRPAPGDDEMTGEEVSEAFSTAETVLAAVQQSAQRIVDLIDTNGQLPEYADQLYRFTNERWAELVDRLDTIANAGYIDAESMCEEITRQLPEDYESRPDDEEQEISLSWWTAEMIEHIKEGAGWPVVE